jgi:hypothetical protein
MKIQITKTSKETIEIEVPQYFEKHGIYSMLGEGGYIRVSDNYFLYSGYTPFTEATVADIIKDNPTTEEEFYKVFHEANEKMEDLINVTPNF